MIILKVNILWDAEIYIPKHSIIAQLRDGSGFG